MSRTSHFLTALLFVALPATATFAHPRPHDRDAYRRPEYRWEHRDHDRNWHWQQRDHDWRRAEYRHERHDRYMEIAQKGHGRPPGWEKGKKTGWGDCDVPPGQAKKQGCEGYSYRRDHRRPHDVRSTHRRPDVRRDDRRWPRRDDRNRTTTPHTTTPPPRPGSTVQPPPQRTTTTGKPVPRTVDEVFRKNPK